jgi:predicted dehydrogenase
MEPLRIGVLGAARIAGLAIVGPAQTTGDRLVAVAARDRRRAEAFAASHGVERVLDSYAEVVADPEVEVVYNPLANGLHGPWNLVAIAAGKHVLTEKPSASNAAEAREVRDAATAAGLTLLEGFHYLYHPVTRRLHELLAGGQLGRLRRVEVDMVIPAPADDDPRWSLELAGGALMDLGCYSLHAHRMLAPWAGGPPRVVAARCGDRAGHPGVDEWLESTWSSPTARPAAPAAAWPATAGCRGGSWVTAARRPRPTSSSPTWTTACSCPPPTGGGSKSWAAVPPTPTSSRPSGRTCATAPPSLSTPTTRWPTCSSSMTATAPPAFHPDQEPPPCS